MEGENAEDGLTYTRTVVTNHLAKYVKKPQGDFLVTLYMKLSQFPCAHSCTLHAVAANAASYGYIRD